MELFAVKKKCPGKPAFLSRSGQKHTRDPTEIRLFRKKIDAEKAVLDETEIVITFKMQTCR